MAMAACGRIHSGSPMKVRTPKRVFDVAMRDGAPVYKAKRVLYEEPLKKDEVYITHKKVLDDWDCGRALAVLGVSQSVLVSEALEKLGEGANLIFQSVGGLAENREDVQIILDNVKSAQGKGTFSRFAYGIYSGLGDGNEAVTAAIKRRGFQVFKEVIAAVAEDDKENSVLGWLTSGSSDAKKAALKAWTAAFEMLEERHKKCHPFNFIGGDVIFAEQALEVLSYVGQTKQEQYADAVYLIQAAVPMLKRRIDEKKAKLAKLKIEKEKREQVILRELDLL